jgi:hypothetical protein
VPTASCGITGGQLGEVAITAVGSQTNSSSTTGTVTSNTATVTVGVQLGLTISPVSANVPAGGTQQFGAELNGVPAGVNWSLSSSSASASGANLGTIDSTGLYTAPPFPPPGNSITITASATSGGNTVTETAAVTIVYSDHTLDGPYSFSYTGNDSSGFLAVAGSFVADGNGNIVSGVEDIESNLDGISTEVPISGTYSVGSDGRGTATLSTSRGANTWRFVLATNLHARLTRFDTNVTGGGVIDQQSLGGLSNSDSAISGRYAFSVFGLDKVNEFPLGMAGEFLAAGNGNIPNTNAVLDVNDGGIGAGAITRGDTSLNGSYAFDSAFPGTGRGTISLSSTTTGTREYAFYTVGAAPNSASTVAQLHLVEIDGLASVAGDMYLAATTPSLVDATYVFTAGGSSSPGAFASGGAFTADGVSNITGGVLDINSGGTYNNGPSVGTCPYSLNSNNGRIDMGLFVGSGTCTSVTGSGVSEFSAYPTALGSVVMLELDHSAVATGLAYQQCGPQSAGCSAATPSLTAISVGLGLVGQGAFRNPPNPTSLFQPDIDGQLTLSGLTSTSAGNLDINNFTATFPNDSLGTTGNTIGSPSSNGRGTASLAPTNPSATYNLVYYLIDDKTALLMSSSQTPVAIGEVARQF